MFRSLILFSCLLALGCGPTGPLPGGKLRGEAASEVPADWAFADAVKNVQLETRPSAPYSVNVWGAGIGKFFHLASGEGGESAWAQHILADPEVRLRVGDTIYELRAVRVEDDAERERFLAALKRKYDWEPESGAPEQAWLFRLEPR